MTELSRLILDQYQIRKTKAQKSAFISLLNEHFSNLYVQQGGLMKSRNLILGDISTAKIILCAHYDTCARMIAPNFITPKNPLFSILYSLVIIIPMGIIVLLLNILLGLLTNNFYVHYIVSVCVWLSLMFLMLAGPANKNTSNDNTSGVILLCELYQAMTAEEKAKAAVVFFDNEELGLIGSTRFRKAYKKTISEKLVVNFDCVSDGDYLLIAASKTARKRYLPAIQDAFISSDLKTMIHARSEQVYYPSDQAGFPSHIAIAALKYNKFLGYYMDRIHTNRDVVFDESNIHFLRNGTLKLIKVI